MDGFDRDILKYMLLWGPHDALYDEDIYPEFGMNVQQFRQRFVHLVASHELRISTLPTVIWWRVPVAISDTVRSNPFDRICIREVP